MLWKGRRQSDNVEDQRGSGGGFGGGFGRQPGQFRIPIGGRAGGGGLSTIVILVVLFFALKACGIDPMQILAGGGGGEIAPGGGQITDNSARTAPQTDDEMKQFVSTVLAETEDVWTGVFQANGLTYEQPKLVLFSGQIRSACGFASAASGPFYCPNDQKVYLDTDFFQQLSRQFGASGDFAEAYVVAHEVGHHVQNLTGILPKFNQMRQRMSEADSNHMSMQVELQADCFAGVWGHFTAQKGILEQGDLEEALNAAQQIGDDTLQKKTQGYVVPESFNHGTSQQRQTWFARGFKSGKLSDCDTFNNPI
ncbi:flagellar biosynthesis protein FlgM [Mesorhizobium sp. Root554]|uniref:KPN_02809 family neutral zinc metallopeptidase n=1 Tax=unclassified Mesorhizobium TaxID=325217 RepID=UPI0006FE8D0F|nr:MULTISPECIES: neutral zinc metallopeptidase [unclassified Mesorhizobium]KQZ14187.1 flagellar biosynthesis protein FlgM [Mesorhizobium sp. Root1471]KQZ36699.1 flagellar biosynthesis protein FlgM [Mesorhizobium sp. Root554]